MPLASLGGTAIENLKSFAKKTDGQIEIERVHGEERLSGLFRYTVQFQFSKEKSTSKGGGAVSTAPPDPSFDDVVGRDVDLKFNRSMADDERNVSRLVSGIVTRIRQHGKGVGNAHLTTTSYLLDIRPALWRLQLSRRNRTFTDCPVVEANDGDTGVLDSLLEEHGLAFDMELKDTYASRKHVSQRDETDLAFFNRVAEEAGVVYYFAADGSLVLTDHNGAYPQYRRFQKNKKDKTVERHDLQAVSNVNHKRKEGVVDSYAFEQNIIPAGMTAQSVYHDKSQVESGTASVQGGGAETTQTPREAPGGLTWYTDEKPTKAWSDNLSGRRVAQLQSAQKVLRVTTASRLLGAGTRFSLKRETCADVLAHFQSSNSSASGNGLPDEVEFVVGRMIVSIENTKEEGNTETVEEVEFEAFPRTDPTKKSSPDYRGDRYAARSAGAGPRSDGAAGHAPVDPYDLSVEATAGPGNEIQPGMYVARVEELPNGNSSEAGQGMVKVGLRLDADVSSKNAPNPVTWARVLSPWAGSGYGSQSLPRVGATVVVAYPGQDTNEYPFVLGSLYDGMHAMPYQKNPGKVGIRSQTRRDGKRFGNQLLMSDEANNEELRAVAPKFRTSVTGMEKDLGDAQRTYYKLKSGANLPDAPSYISATTYKSLPSKSDEVCHLKPFVKELMEEYGGEAGANEDLSLSARNSKPKDTALKLKASVGKDIKEKIRKEAGLKDFVNDMTEELRVHRSNDVSWSVVKNGEAAVDRVIDADEYERLEEKTKFEVTRTGGATEHKEGITELGNIVKGIDKAETKDYESVAVTAVGRDAYEDKIRSYRRAYEFGEMGQDAYDVEPYKEAYEDAGKEDVLDRSEKGVLDVCEGQYQIHTFGDRLEICRAPVKSGTSDVLAQEKSGDFKKDENLNLPGRFSSLKKDDENPLLILNKNGTISLQAEKGINIESGEDVQIQAGGSIKMHAKEKISSIAKEIQVGDAKETHNLEHQATHHHKKHSGIVIDLATSILDVSYGNIGISHGNIGIGDTVASISEGTLSASHTTVSVAISEAIGKKIDLIRKVDRMAVMENSLAQTRNELTSAYSTLAETHKKVSDNEIKIAQNEQIVSDFADAVIRQSSDGMAIAMDALYLNQ